ncbi:amidohydrolase family protein [Streptomyces sp. LP05-1]|uniref:Amidohydrolase family protein n=1 Tax=Streptomyces pyxinae TaxID=2970734 RepID=A0ABT2CBK4_9ACTN|nr:amidohydrolase [Streptomyces sp. LP05-1]MCS0634792.1 amidohydrolase family protein [Streptomyces sp. LP05-1]
MDPGRPAADALGVWQGRVVGLDEEIRDLPARRVLDLAGATVLPGFVDPHVHLAWSGLKSRTADVSPSRSAGEILAVVRRAAEAATGAWVDVVGYDQRPLGRHLTAAELDAAGGGRRVIVTHDSGHSCVVSSAVLALLPDGVAHSDGVLVESGMAAVRALRMPYRTAELRTAIARAAAVCVSEGVTSCAEAGIGAGLIAHSPVEAEPYQQLLAAGELPLRVQLMVAAAALRPVAGAPDDGPLHAVDLGLRTGFGGERLGLGALKVFADGGMMARTAALTEPYEGLDHGGQLYADEADPVRTVVDGHLAGWQLAIHAIGDRAVDVALDALAEAHRARPRPAARHRIEHAGLVRPDQLPRFRELAVTAVVQPSFLWYFGDDYARLMGPGRAPWLYRGQSFLDHGVALAASSDRPVTPGAPLRAVGFLARRLSASGRPVGPDEAMTVDNALRAYTVGGARACGWEDRVGTLAPGRCADWVVLPADPAELSLDAVGELPVRETWVAGEPVHES